MKTDGNEKWFKNDSKRQKVSPMTKNNGYDKDL